MGVWGVVIFVLSVMRLVGGVPLWVECVFRRVDVVCLCLLYTNTHKRVMSRLIQVRQHQTNESGFVISAIKKYVLGSRHP